MKNGKHDFGFGKMNMPILEGCGFKSQAAPGYRVGFPVKSHHLAAVSCSYDGYYLAGFGFGLGVMGSWAFFTILITIVSRVRIQTSATCTLWFNHRVHVA